MSDYDLQEKIEKLWADRDGLSSESPKIQRDLIEETIKRLDSGKLRVAKPVMAADDHSSKIRWEINEWVKKAVLLYFKTTANQVIVGGPGDATWFDKVPHKFDGWDLARWRRAGFRAVPGAIARKGAFIGKGVILMPSFVNIGAYVSEGTMVDTSATVGSCAQIGKNCHLSGGVGIGGVLEPLQASPTIIEDNCFIGARSEVVEGVIVREGSVLGMGVFIGKSTKIVDRETGEVMYGEVPAGSVVVAGSMPSKGGINLYCAVIVKKVDAQTRAKTSINELLRD